jgi:hypothetical protein
MNPDNPLPLKAMLPTSSLHYRSAERLVVEPLLCHFGGARTLFDLCPSPTSVLMASRRATFGPIPWFQVSWLVCVDQRIAGISGSHVKRNDGVPRKRQPPCHGRGARLDFPR